jgi:hypothetical protein
MSWRGASGQVSTNVSPNVWCQNTGHSNSNVRYLKNSKLNTDIKRVSGLQSFKYFVLSVLKVKIKSPGRKIFILWDMVHVTYRLEAIVSKITRHKDITYYTPYIIILGNSQTYASVDAQLRSHIIRLP